MRHTIGVAAGFTVKSGWASVVLATGSAASPRVIDSRRIDLSDPALPESRQPYHAGTGTARPEGPERSRLITSVERYGRRSVTDTLDRYQRDGHAPGLSASSPAASSIRTPSRTGTSASTRSRGGCSGG